MLEQHQELYIPPDERSLQRVQRKVQILDDRIRNWAAAVIAYLPKGLSILEDETHILGLYLAQQRRLNLEMDAENGPESLRSRLGRALPFLGDGEDDWEMTRAVHRMVAACLEADTDEACQRFCSKLEIPPVSDPAIDWRVAMRYMAQQIHRVAIQIDVRGQRALAPHRFELALAARDLAMEVSARRRQMLMIFLPDKETA